MRHLTWPLVGLLCVSLMSSACSDDVAPSEREGDDVPDVSDDGGLDTAPDTSADTDTDPPDTAPGDTGDTNPDDAGDTDDAPVDESCPSYQDRCEGECIPTSVDPENCGGCGVVCEGSDVCSGGSCVDPESCPGELEACGGACVDTSLDSDHCGGCGITCDAGEGCVAGTCREVIALEPGPASCEGVGPVIDFEPGQGSPQACAGDLAEYTFRWGLCSCDDVVTNVGLMVDAYDSSVGPYTPGGPGGGVGTNGSQRANGLVDVTGSLWVAGSEGINLNIGAEIGQRLYNGGDFYNNNPVSVGEDAFMVGDIDTNLGVTIGGDLNVPAGTSIHPNVTYQSLNEGPVSVGDACSYCEEDDRIDVAAIVASRRDVNDNATIGLEPDVLENATGGVRLELPCGNYYLSEITPNLPTTIVATGNTALYVDGDIESNGQLTITLTPDASFDIFVAGDVRTNERFRLGSPNYPALMRMYVGGPNGFRSNNQIDVGGYIYAVPGGIETNNDIEIFGGLHGSRFGANNQVSIHYDRGVGRVGQSCPDPDTDPDPDPGDDVGPDPDVDPDPDPDPVCGSTDDGCASDSDCCSPLRCEEGVCALLSCQPAYLPCSRPSDCCSGMCTASGSQEGVCIVP
ncbi:hypothetical protein DV096_14560 [Bradymonadaceae bacterium TMQ3]|uniref:DUF7305 domain-containing protein n=1 Tax=Lujinxingia sediminis TaxID=2480984 RepID=A0ABY0CW60_9DELT|nr:hypothetical protein [Lujinxingia sediminis]RDV37203.1 hypothetical protein DV096_14560 [Bradymonadaceae bacterium TMQ3]RVU46849.1 hypothetical protein EA187_06870 [Lujinxingia sediminis]TXC74858.1 hypothetical protein FRC91_15005 [Bradymonadales bacterium TMQ1]